jgi:hypothetical protein
VDVEERRLADEQHRREMGERIAKLETRLDLSLNEIKSITEGMFRELTSLKNNVADIHSTLYGGPKDKIGLIGKMSIATFLITSVVGVAWHFVVKKLEPTTELVQQSTSKRIQLFNRKTGEYEYYMAVPKRVDDD